MVEKCTPCGWHDFLGNLYRDPRANCLRLPRWVSDVGVEMNVW